MEFFDKCIWTVKLHVYSMNFVSIGTNMKLVGTCPEISCIIIQRASTAKILRASLLRAIGQLEKEKLSFPKSGTGAYLCTLGKFKTNLGFPPQEKLANYLWNSAFMLLTDAFF